MANFKFEYHKSQTFNYISYGNIKGKIAFRVYRALQNQEKSKKIRCSLLHTWMIETPHTKFREALEPIFPNWVGVWVDTDAKSIDEEFVKKYTDKNHEIIVALEKRNSNE